jgi:hypothetical protein
MHGDRRERIEKRGIVDSIRSALAGLTAGSVEYSVAPG